MRSRLRVALAATVAAAVMSPAASSAGHGLTANPASPTTATGAYFTVSGKSTGGRDYVDVEVSCVDGTQALVYATRIVVTLTDGSGYVSAI